jgi:hypothetical protein
MDDTILSSIIQDAQRLPPELQARWIVERAIKTDRATAAAISDEALQAELDAWWQREYGCLPGSLSSSMALDWARHLLSGVRYAT